MSDQAVVEGVGDEGAAVAGEAEEELGAQSLVPVVRHTGGSNEAPLECEHLRVRVYESHSLTDSLSD